MARRKSRSQSRRSPKASRKSSRRKSSRRKSSRRKSSRRKSSRRKSSRRKSSRSKSVKTFVCPYKKNGELVKKMSKSKLVSNLLKELNISTTSAAGKRKKNELSKASTSELQKHLHGILNAKTEKKMKSKHDAKVKDLIKKGIIVKRTPAEKMALRASGMGPTNMGNIGLQLGPGPNVRPNVRPIGVGGQGPQVGIVKMMVCKNKNCQLFAKPLRAKTGSGQRGGGCPSCGVIGSILG